MSSIFLASQNDLSNAKRKLNVFKATKIMFKTKEDQAPFISLLLGNIFFS